MKPNNISIEVRNVTLFSDSGVIDLKMSVWQCPLPLVVFVVFSSVNVLRALLFRYNRDANFILNMLRLQELGCQNLFILHLFLPPVVFMHQNE